MEQSVTGLLSMPLIAQAGAGVPTGGYFALWKIIIMLVLITPSLAAAPWVHKEAQRLRLSSAWGASMLAAGAVGLLLWLLLPFYMVGLLVYVVLAVAVFTAYAVQHDAKVPPEQKILTGAFFSSLFGGVKFSEQVQVVTQVKLYDYRTNAVLAPDETSDPATRKAYNLTQQFLHDLLWRRAGEADLAPAGNQTRLRYVIDGVVVNRPAMPLADGEAIIQCLKPLAGMDAEDRRRPQTGKIAVDLTENNPMDVILTTTGTTGGQRMQLRIVQETARTELDSLGMSEDILQKVRAFGKSAHGLIIVSGRSGSGVTSTLYSLLRQQDAFIKQLVTLESKVLVDLENVTQNGYQQAAKLPEALASALRREPDAIMVDRCSEPRTAAMIREAAAKKLLLLGMHAPDAFTALAKWVQLCGEPAEALANLRCALCQVLVRKLCPNCREAYRPDPQLLAKANIPAQGIENFYRQPTKPMVDDKGQPFTCPACQGSGYFDRTAAFELLEITDEIRRLAISGASVSQIKAAARKNKMLYLQEQCLRKVIAGDTSIQEVIRVTQTKK